MALSASPASAVVRVRPVAGTAALNAVACPTARTCVAVGTSNGDQLSRTAVVVPAPGGRPGSLEPVSSDPGWGDLVGVACENRSSCFAVGQLRVGPVGSVVTISNGVPSANQVQADGSVTDVSCASGNSCAVVGYTNEDSPPEVMVYPLDAGVLGQPVYGIGYPQLLQGVDCLSQTNCMTVGWDLPTLTTGPTYGGLVEPYNNGTLSAGQFVANYDLNAVACPTATDCLAVGDGAQGAVIVPITNGTPGTAVPISGTSSLSAISCPNQHRCVASGQGSNGEGAFLRIHNGVPRRTRYVPGTEALAGIACPSINRCVASGFTPAAEGVIATLP